MSPAPDDLGEICPECRNEGQGNTNNSDDHMDSGQDLQHSNTVGAGWPSNPHRKRQLRNVGKFV